MTELLTEREAAALLHVSVKCLQGWRSRGGGPPYRKIGRCVRYEKADLETFVEQAVRRSTSDPGPRRNDPPRIRTEPLLEKTGRRLNATPPHLSEPIAAPTPAPILKLRRRVRLRHAYIRPRPKTP